MAVIPAKAGIYCEAQAEGWLRLAVGIHPDLV
jgi:hypothetical protein